MNIIDVTYNWNGTLSGRKSTEYIVLHHRAGNGDVQSIHKEHVNQGWSGIGYHFYVRKDGSIYRGRPINIIGAHCPNYNSRSVAVCFEGNFETEQMGDKQLNSGIELVKYLRSVYPSANVLRHRDLYATACPGKHFPIDEIKQGVTYMKDLTSANDIAWEISQQIKINDMNGFVTSLEIAKQNNSPLYWALKKLADKF